MSESQLFPGFSGISLSKNFQPTCWSLHESNIMNSNVEMTMVKKNSQKHTFYTSSLHVSCNSSAVALM